MKYQIARQGDVEHRKQQGVRHNILDTVSPTATVAFVRTNEGPYRWQSLAQFPKTSSPQSDKHAVESLLGAEIRRMSAERRSIPHKYELFFTIYVPGT